MQRDGQKTDLGDSSTAEGDYSVAIESEKREKENNCLRHASAFSKRDSAPTPKAALACQWWIGRTRQPEQKQKKNGSRGIHD